MFWFEPIKDSFQGNQLFEEHLFCLGTWSFIDNIIFCATFFCDCSNVITVLAEFMEHSTLRSASFGYRSKTNDLI